jgi:hypothetical protein
MQTITQCRRASRIFEPIMLCLVSLGCSHPHGNTPDAVLRTNFSANESSFLELRAMVLEDRDFLTISTKYVITKTQTVNSPPARLELVGLSRERYQKYVELFHSVGLDGVFRGEGGVVFRVNNPTLWNGDSSKGYMYSLAEPTPCVSNLDSYVPASRAHPWRVYSRLKQHWYLYLAVG